MSHKIIILPAGVGELREYDSNGEEISSEEMTWDELLALGHAAIQIIIESPTLELNNKIIQAAKKYFE